MVRSVVFALVLAGVLVGGPAMAQESSSGASEDGKGDKGPVLYGDGAGRLWKWQGGEKTFLSSEGRNLVLGGVGEKQLWGWAVDRDLVRFFTLELPKKKKESGAAAEKTPEAGKSPKDEKSEPPAVPTFDPGSYPVPDRADRMDGRILLVYGALSGHSRYEVWQGGAKVAARAWDDGRTVYSLALGPQDGWIVAGRTKDGTPWLEVSGTEVLAPEGWRGRLTVAAWVPEKEEKKDAKSAEKAKDPKAKPLPPPVHPWAAGWGAPGAEAPRPLFWGPEGWTQPDPEAGPKSVAGTYPVLGQAGEGVLNLAGWQADDGTGVLRPWFWDGEAAKVPGGSSDGQPQAFSLGGKGGAFLVVRHQSAPWFTQEDGKESIPLEGLGSDDRVIAVESGGDSPAK